jgi:large subunit ribosomal protein L1
MIIAEAKGTQLLEGKINPDKIIATPSMLAVIQRHPTLPRFLGPKNLFPSAKRGTVVEDVAQAIIEAQGALDWKGNANGVICAGNVVLISFPKLSD